MASILSPFVQASLAFEISQTDRARRLAWQARTARNEIRGLGGLLSRLALPPTENALTIALPPGGKIYIVVPSNNDSALLDPKN